MKIIKKILKIIIMIVFIPIMLYSLIIIAKTIIEPEKTPSVMGIKTFTVITGSMEPSINIGDIVLVKESEEEYKIGEIISYKDNKNIVTHRIVEIEKDKKGKNIYKTKGDKNNINDDILIKDNMIEGKVVKIIPKIGILILFIEDNIFLILILIILCAIIF